MLISARMDEHLDRADSRALLVHLQACESCRAFAVQSEVLGRELAAIADSAGERDRRSPNSRDDREGNQPLVARVALPGDRRE